MIRTIAWAMGILGAVLLLQTTVLGYLAVGGFHANLLWVVFVVLAAQNGSFTSQIVGFVLGLAVDMVSTSPLGYHAFQFTLAGYLFGLGTGKVYFDPLAMPALLGFLVTLYELLSGLLINFLFQLGQPQSVFFNFGVLFQAVLNVVLAPIVFWIYGWARDRFQDPRRGFGG